MFLKVLWQTNFAISNRFFFFFFFYCFDIYDVIARHMTILLVFEDPLQFFLKGIFVQEGLLQWNTFWPGAQRGWEEVSEGGCGPSGVWNFVFLKQESYVPVQFGDTSTLNAKLESSDSQKGGRHPWLSWGVTMTLTRSHIDSHEESCWLYIGLQPDSGLCSWACGKNWVCSPSVTTKYLQAFHLRRNFTSEL